MGIIFNKAKKIDASKELTEVFHLLIYHQRCSTTFKNNHDYK